MSEQPYMQLWIADFLGDTLHLSDAEVGQYMLLLMAMWRAGGYLPNNPDKLARVARAPVSDAVMSMFSKCEANAEAKVMICQKRLLAELDKARAKSIARSEAGKAGVEAKALKNKKRPSAKARAIATANGQAKVKHSPEPEPLNNNTPFLVLKSVLDEGRAQAVLEHRKRKSPLTTHAARLLAAEFAKFPDPNTAADEMIARGWQGFKAEWMTNGKGQGPPAPAGTYPKRTWAEQVAARKQQQTSEH